MNRSNIVRVLALGFALAAAGCAATAAETEDERTEEVGPAGVVDSSGRHITTVGDSLTSDPSHPASTYSGPHPDPWLPYGGPHPDPWTPPQAPGNNPNNPNPK